MTSELDALRRQAEIDTAALNCERALADDLAEVLSPFLIRAMSRSRRSDVERVLARYREARA